MPSPLQLQLKIKGKQSSSFVFSLDGTTKPSGVLQVAPYYLVEATIVGSFQGGNNPYFELSAGFDPDVRFVSGLIQNGDTCIPLRDPISNPNDKPKLNLFQQVYGPSLLTLRYWDDIEGDDHNSIVVFQVRIFGSIPREKRFLYESLQQYLLDYSNGQFLLDALRGQRTESFELLFMPGFTDDSDSLVHLECIKELVNKAFLHHLDGVVRRPFMTIRQIPSICKASKVRKLSPKNYEIVADRGQDSCSVLESTNQPSFTCGCNDVIATFLNKLVIRLSSIQRDLVNQRNKLEGRYRDAHRILINSKKSKTNAIPNVFDFPLVESDKEILTARTRECETISTVLKRYLTHAVFAYAPSRQAIVFNVPFSEFSRTKDYRFLYEAIRKYETTRFYWTGDDSPFYRLPAFRYSETGKDYWIRKYSIMYEHWCYLRIHDTLSNLGFFTKDHPKIAPMSYSVFDKNGLHVYLFHDVRPQSIPPTIPKPILQKFTPDFGIVFEKNGKYALLVLDSKSNAKRPTYLAKTLGKYISAGLGRSLTQSLVMVQCWIILSGEDEDPSRPFIETPLKKEEYSDLSESVYDSRNEFSWCNGGFQLAQSLSNDPNQDVPRYVGYLRTHIRRIEDVCETDHFVDFLSAQVQLMNSILQ